MGHRRPIVAVVGDARIEAGSHKARVAYELGIGLSRTGYVVMTGGHAGIAKEASRGAIAGSDGNTPCTVALLPEGDPRTDDPEYSIVIPTGIGLVRSTLVAQATAVVAIGGGAGTLSEIAYAWMYRRLIIGFRVEGWSGRLADTRVDERVRFENIPEDRIFGVDSVAEALDVLAKYLPHYGAVKRLGNCS